MLYHTNSFGFKEPAFRAAFSKACSLASSAGKALVLRAHTEKMAAGGMFDQVWGEKKIKYLIEQKEIMVDEDVVMLLETDRRSATRDKAVFFAPYCNGQALRLLISDCRVIELVYVPWAEGERDTYILENPKSEEIIY